MRPELRSSLTEIRGAITNEWLRNQLRYCQAIQVDKLGVFKLNENTMATRDEIVGVSKLFSTGDGTGNSSCSATFAHDQYDTNLCHSYATLSCFRQLLITLVKSKIEMQAVNVSQSLQDLYPFDLSDPNIFTRSLLNDIQRMKTSETNDVYHELIDSAGDCSFQKMLTVFLGCVNPRGFISSYRQAARTETVIARLVYKTEFEIEGWKRILPVQYMMDRLDLDIDDFELTYQKVTHPNSKSVEMFLNMARGDSWFIPEASLFEVQH